ncbi:hypothetical protein [Klebsiella variicola]|uniref:hypothetical protein n=1 Tax=Klebsiella variicola TaxID=244366 RepID=UPI002B057F3D|nr:hypothetical protein [Klebsiella variicola]
MTITLQAVNELIASLESAGELSIREQKFLKLAKAFKQLAAENVALKLKGRELLNEASKVYQKYNATIDFYSGDFMDGQTLHEFQFVLDAETPLTDSIVAGIKADAANQMCVTFVKHKELAGLSDDDVVKVREATDAVLHCAEVISKGADK